MKRAPLAIWVAAAAAARAQGSAPAPPVAPPAAQQIVVEGRSGSPDEQRRQSTLGMTVVGRDELDAYGDTSVLDVLQRLPGITIDGDTPRLRGLGAGYTQILLNGEPAPPGFSLDSLSPSEIERIEVIKGPSAEFGGVAGTINVILRSVARVRQNEGRAALGYRALQPQGMTTLSLGDRRGALGWVWPLTVSRWANAADLDTQRRSREPDGSQREERVAGREESRGGGLNFAPRLEWKPGDEDSLGWNTLIQRNESDNRSRRDTLALAGPPPASARQVSATRGHWQSAWTQLQWVRKRADGSRFELKAAARSSLGRSAGTAQGEDAAGTPGVLRDTLASQRDAGTTLAARWREPLAAGHVLAAGLDLELRQRRELRRRFDDGLEQFSGSLGRSFRLQTRRDVAFVQDEWEPAERWSLLLGLRAEAMRWTSPAADDAIDSRFDAVTPLLHLRHALDAAGRDLVRASLSRSLRAPDSGLLLPRYTLNSAYDRDTPNTPIAADSAGNPALRPERATAFEAAWEQHLAGGGVLSVGVFHRQIDGLIRRRLAIEAVPEAAVPRWVSRPVNLGAARSSGLELELKGSAAQLLGASVATLAVPKGLQLRAALSLYRSRVEQIDDPDARLDGQAPWNATTGFDHALPGGALTFGGNLSLTPAFSTRQTDLQRVWRGAARRLDAYLLWRIDRQTQLRLAANNLLHPDTVSSSRLDDALGLAAASQTRRTTVALVTANLAHKF